MDWLSEFLSPGGPISSSFGEYSKEKDKDHWKVGKIQHGNYGNKTEY